MFNAENILIKLEVLLDKSLEFESDYVINLLLDIYEKGYCDGQLSKKSDLNDSKSDF